MWPTVSLKLASGPVINCTADKKQMASMCNKRADEAERKSQDDLTKYTDLVKSTKPTGDPNPPSNVMQAKETERIIEESVLMATLNDTAQRTPIQTAKTGKAASRIRRQKRLLQGRAPWNVFVLRELRLLSRFHSGTGS
jgi:hypothetical protein